jgi:hypothetical protein
LLTEDRNMAFMFARVELHYPADGDYDKLHTYMHDAQFHRRMTSLGQTCDLPWAYYASDKYELSTAALTSVQNATQPAPTSAARKHPRQKFLSEDRQTVFEDSPILCILGTAIRSELWSPWDMLKRYFSIYEVALHLGGFHFGHTI